MKLFLLKLWAGILSVLYLFVFPWNSQVQPNCIPETRSYKGAVPDKYNIWPTELFAEGEKPWWLRPERLELRYQRKLHDRKTGGGNQVDSFLILHKGKLVYEKYYNNHTADTPHYIASVNKSFVSALVGVAIGEGLIGSVEDKVLDYFPEAVGMPGWDERKRDITVEHFLTMNSGIYWEDESDGEAWDGYFAEGLPDRPLYAFLLPQKAQPGKTHKYENVAFVVPVGIIERASGMDIMDYAQEKLFAPLGITSAEWWTNDAGESMGFLYAMTPRDMARFGYLYLNYGRWEDRQILPATYVKRTPPKSISPKAYGWLFYNTTQMPFIGSYQAVGAGGQFICVTPVRDLVYVCTGSHREEPITRRELRKSVLGK